MFKKFKSFLSKIIKDKRLKIILFSFVILLSIFIPLKRVDALWGIADIGLFDLTETQLDALDFVDSVILRLIIYVASLIVVSEAFILTAANLLEWAMNLPINIGATNLLVTSGWQFILGLTNLFFILAFVIIALAHTLGLSNFEMKKALPRLIIMALLVNFSLVFMGIFIDIVSVFQSSILDALGENLVTLAVQPLITSSQSVAAWFFLIPIAAIASAFAPFWNAVALAGIGTLLLTDIAVGGIFLKGLFLIIINFLIGSIFFSYFVFFLMRVVMIWILAIFAPFAFLSSVLTQTESFWREWFKTFMEWLILGIAVIFLTGLGLKLFATVGQSAILNWGGNINTGRGSLPSFIYNYLFLLVYMGIAFFYSIKYTPQMAQTLLSYGKSFMGGLGKIATSDTMKRDVWGPAAEKLAGAEKWGQRLIGGAKKAKVEGKTGRAMFMRWAGRGAGGLGKVVSRGTKPFRPGLIEYAAQQRRTAKPKGWDQMSVADKANYIDALTQDKEKMVLASRMASEGTFANAGNEFQEQIIGIAKDFSKDDKNRELYGKEIGDIYNVIPDSVTMESELDLKTKTEDKEKLRQSIEEKSKEIMNIAEQDSALDDTIENGRGNLTKEQYVQNLAAACLRFKAMKPADLVKMKKSSLTSLAGRLASHDMTSQQIQRIYNTFGRDTIEDMLNGGGGLNAVFDGKGKDQGRKILDQTYLRNSALVHFFANTPAGRAMNWSGLKYMDKNSSGKIDFDKFKERMSGEKEETKESIEKRLSLELEKEKNINQSILKDKNGLKRTGIETIRTRLEKQIKEKEKTLKTIQTNIKTLQKDMVRSTTKKIPRIEQLEQGLTSALEEERNIKKALSGNKDEIRKAKTAEIRVNLQKQAEEKQQELKSVQVNIGTLQKDYEQEWMAEKLKEKPKPSISVLSKQIGELRNLDQAAEKIETSNALILSKLDARKRVSELTEKEQELYKQYKEVYNSAVTKRKEIKGKLGASEKYANKISLRLNNIQGIENNLEIAKKDALMKGYLNKNLKIESALKELRQEKESVTKDYQKTPQQILEHVQGRKEIIETAPKSLEKLSKDPVIVSVKNLMEKLEKDLKLPQSNADNRRIKGEISNLEKRYPSIFKGIPEIRKRYKKTIDVLKKSTKETEKLRIQKLTALSKLDLNKYEEVKTKLSEQIAKSSDTGRTLSNMSEKIEVLKQEIYKEERKGRTP